MYGHPRGIGQQPSRRVMESLGLGIGTRLNLTLLPTGLCRPSPGGDGMLRDGWLDQQRTHLCE